jgi:DNA polymerase III gamma/tau subunit
LAKMVAKREGLDFTAEVYEEIADKSAGSARTTLVLLEKVAQLSSEKALALIKDFVDEENEEIISLCRALLNRAGWSEISGILKKLKEEEPESIRWAIMSYMSAVLLNGKENGRAGLALEMFSEPFYNSGFSGVVLASFQVVTG